MGMTAWEWEQKSVPAHLYQALSDGLSSMMNSDR